MNNWRHVIDEIKNPPAQKPAPKGKPIGRPRKDGLAPGSPEAKAADHAKKGTKRSAPCDLPRHQEWEDLFTQGQTAGQIAKRYDVTPQAVSLVLIARGVDTKANQRTARVAARIARDSAKADAMYAKVLVAMANAVPCCVCGNWVVRTNCYHNESQRNRTCSPECGKLWRTGSVRFAVSATESEVHRAQCARSILRHPDGQRPSKIAWAERVLSDDPPPKNRTYAVSTSLTTQALVNAGLVPEPVPKKPRVRVRDGEGRQRSDAKLFTGFGETKTIDEWLSDPRCIPLSKAGLRRRIKLGMSLEEAVSTPRNNPGNTKPKRKAQP
jgi:hypothetical protein